MAAHNSLGTVGFPPPGCQGTLLGDRRLVDAGRLPGLPDSPRKAGEPTQARFSGARLILKGSDTFWYGRDSWLGM